jgi:hypothetical protein
MILGLMSEDKKLIEIASDMLVRIHGFRAFDFDDKVRLCLVRLNPFILSAGMRVAELVARAGWKPALKEFEELRALVRSMDRDVGRACFAPEFWLVNALDYMCDQDAEHGDRDWVVYPLEHQHEYHELECIGGKVLRIDHAVLHKNASVFVQTKDFCHEALVYKDNESFYLRLMELINDWKSLGAEEN